MTTPRYNVYGDEILVTVADLIAYLQELPPETEVYLDKDGWLDDELDNARGVELIKKRGVFRRFRAAGDVVCLFINN